MASQAGRRGELLATINCATKATVISLTQSAGLALINHGINVNAISLSTGKVSTLFCQSTRNVRSARMKRIVGEGVPLRPRGDC